MKRFLALFMSVSLLIMTPVTSIVTYAESAEKDDSKIVIVSTNDAHCQIDKVDNDDPAKAYLGYECVAGVKLEKEETYSNVALVDAGDHIQGNPVGILTKGEAIIKIMNAAGYDVSTLGNHEFDYGVSRLMELTDMAEYPYVSCNFVDLRTGETVYDPYYTVSYDTSEGKKTVAYVGVTTPEAISKSTPKFFQDENGNYIYGFCTDETGEALYNKVQGAVDDARDNGADYVVLVGHLGQDGVTNIWRSDTIVANTSGIDAVVDGHSHEAYTQEVKNKDGEDVFIIQAGTLLNAVGVTTIDVETGEVSGEILHATLPSDETTAGVVAEVDEELNTILNKEVAQSEVDLKVFEDDNWTWKVRSTETNMGDLVTDACRVVMDADIGITGGGGIRNNIDKGTVTAQDVLSVQPFGNDISVIRVTGQQILDCLEMGAHMLPESNGGFMQVSGLTYKVDTSIPTSVEIDTEGMFVKVGGDYRVWDVKVNGEPLDLEKEYTVAGTSYELLNSGDGMSMFKGCEVVVQNGPKDFELLEQYITDNLNGVIGSEYEGADGQGRIQFAEKTDISGKTAVLSGTSYTYNGKAKKPAVTMEGLTEGTDFTVSYSNNVKAGTATVKVTGIGDYKGTVTAHFTIAKRTISTKGLKLKTNSFIYNGKKKTVALNFTPSLATMKVSGNSAVKVGTYTAKYIFTPSDTANMKMDRSTYTFNWKINPAKAAVKSLTSGSGKLSVKASTKVSTKGGSYYQIGYKQKGGSKWYYTTTTSCSKIIKGLKKGKSYYVKIRACKKVSGKTYAGAWSGIKTSKTVK